MAENKTLTFKGRPLMRKDNIITTAPWPTATSS